MAAALTFEEVMELGRQEGMELDEDTVLFTLGFAAGWDAYDEKNPGTILTIRQRVGRVVFAMDADDDGRVSYEEVKDALMAASVDMRITNDDAKHHRDALTAAWAGRDAVPVAELVKDLTDKNFLGETDLPYLERYLGIPSRTDGANEQQRLEALVTSLDADEDGSVQLSEFSNLLKAEAYRRAVSEVEYEVEQEAREIAGDDGATHAELMHILGGHLEEDPKQLSALERYFNIAAAQPLSKKERVQALMHSLDTNHDGLIDLDELKEVFTVTLMHHRMADTEATARSSAAAILGSKGSATVEEVSKTLPVYVGGTKLDDVERYLAIPSRPDGGLVSARIAAVVKALDVDGDGVIDGHELANAFIACSYAELLKEVEYDAEEQAREVVGDEGISPHDLYTTLGHTWEEPAWEPELLAAEAHLAPSTPKVYA